MIRVPEEAVQKLIDRMQKRFHLQDVDVCWHSDEGDSSPRGHMTTFEPDMVEMGVVVTPASWVAFARTVTHEFLHIAQHRFLLMTEGKVLREVFGVATHTVWKALLDAEIEAFTTRMTQVLEENCKWDDSDLAEGTTEIAG